MTQTASTDLFAYYRSSDTTLRVSTSFEGEGDSVNLNVGVNYRAAVTIEVKVIVNTPNDHRDQYTIIGKRRWNS